MGWNWSCDTQPPFIHQRVTKHFAIIITYLARQLHRIVNQVNFKDYMPNTYDKNDIYHIYLRSLQNSRNVLQANVAFDRFQKFGKNPDSAIKLQLRIQTEHF